MQYLKALSSVLYPVGFRCPYTGLGAQINEKQLRKNLMN